jgi:hypothetical protein
MQHERVSVRAEIGDDERRLVGHQPGDEMDVTREPIELRNNDRSLVLARRLKGGSELRPLVERIRPFTGLNLFKGLNQVEALGLGKTGERSLLRFETKTRPALLSVQILAVPRGSRLAPDGSITIDGDPVTELASVEPYTGTPPLGLTDQREPAAPVEPPLPVIEVDTSNVTVLRRRDDEPGPGAA